VKKSTLFELNFTAKGTVHVPCDLTNEYFDLEITTTLPLVVKFGPEYNDENEEILVLPHEVYQFSVAQFIYEMIVLGVPTKRIHPDVTLCLMSFFLLLNSLIYPTLGLLFQQFFLLLFLILIRYQMLQIL